MGADVAAKPQLVMVNLLDPLEPVEVGQLDPSSTSVGLVIVDVVLEGSYAYLSLAGPGGGLWVVDISEPSSPNHSGLLPIEQSLLIDDLSVAYLAGATINDASDADRITPGEPGLFVVDVSNPAQLTVNGSLAGSVFGRPTDVAVLDSVAYLVGPIGLRVIDVSDTTNPREITAMIDLDSPLVRFDDPDKGIAGFRAAESSMRGIAVQDGYAYVASGFKGLRVIDVSTPGSPREVSSIKIGSAEEVLALGNLVYVYDFSAPPQAENANGIRLIDVSQPDSPRLIGSLDVQTGGSAVVLGNYSYVVDRFRNIIVIPHVLN